MHACGGGRQHKRGVCGADGAVANMRSGQHAEGDDARQLTQQLMSVLEEVLVQAGVERFVVCSHRC